MSTLVKKVSGGARGNGRKYLPCFAPLAILAIIFGDQPAQAQTRLGLTCVRNTTRSTINFEYQFGDKPWQATDVRPGYWRTLEYWYDFPGQNSGPPLRIRFDADMSSGRYYVMEPLKQYAVRTAKCSDGGRRYNFYQQGNRLYLESER